MIAATALASVKTRLSIESGVTTFDAAINEFVLSAVSRLYPIAQKELVPEEKTVTPDGYGEVVVSLSGLTGAPQSIRKVEAYSGGAWSENVDDVYHQGTNLYVRGLDGAVTKLRLYGVGLFALADVPVYLEQAIIWFAMSEFYDLMAGSKSKYNIYMQSGARNVDNMQDESDRYEQKANVYLADRVQLYGVQ